MNLGYLRTIHARPPRRRWLVEYLMATVGPGNRLPSPLHRRRGSHTPPPPPTRLVRGHSTNNFNFDNASLAPELKLSRVRALRDPRISHSNSTRYADGIRTRPSAAFFETLQFFFFPLSRYKFLIIVIVLRKKKREKEENRREQKGSKFRLPCYFSI